MIPSSLTLLIPAIATVIAGWLKSDQLPGWANDLIVCLAFAVAVIVSVLIGGGFTADTVTNLTLIITAAAAIFALLRPFMNQATTALPSPLTRLFPRPRLARIIVDQGQASQAVTPTTRRASLPAQPIDAHNVDTLKVTAIPDFKIAQRPPTYIPGDGSTSLRRRRPSWPPVEAETAVDATGDTKLPAPPEEA